MISLYLQDTGCAAIARRLLILRVVLGGGFVELLLSLVLRLLLVQEVELFRVDSATLPPVPFSGSEMEEPTPLVSTRRSTKAPASPALQEY